MLCCIIIIGTIIHHIHHILHIHTNNAYTPIHLYYCSAITDEGLRSLRTMHAKLTVLSIEGLSLISDEGFGPLTDKCTALQQVNVNTYIYTYTYTHTYTYSYIHIHTYTYIHIHTYTYSYIHIHIYTYTYIHIHTYTYSYIHTYKYTHS
jgi:hypothetical protein